MGVLVCDIMAQIVLAQNSNSFSFEITSSVQNIESTLCLISGTSACHMILNKKKMMIPRIWGPYFSAVLGDYWLHEG